MFSRRSLLGLLAVSGAGFGSYAYYTQQQENSNPYKFKNYTISNKYAIDENHFLLELQPPQKYVWPRAQISSIEIKQPEIMVARSYTPLPYAISTQNGKLELKPDNSKLLLYIKTYSQGEVARWLDKQPVDAKLDVRGPFVEYIHPEGEKIQFLTAGTGITSALQLISSDSDIKMRLVHSAHTESELGPLVSLVKQFEESGNCKMDIFDSSKNGRLTLDGVDPKEEGVVSVVCGPDGYIRDVAGVKGEFLGDQGALGGMLKEKGWDSDTVYKM